MGVESALTKQWRASYEMARDECSRLRADNDRLRALLLHVANNAEFDEGACKDWRGWIKHKMEGGNDLGAG